MAFKALIPFELFISRVNVSIDEALHTRAVQLDRIKNQKDYCHLVSERARHLRKKHDNSIVRWERWLADIAEELGDENRDLIEKISQEEVYEAGRSTKKIHLIYALHYRLHAEFLYTSYARDIDIQVFGEPFEDKYGKPVFKEFKKSTLGVSHPASIKLDNTYQYGRPEFEETKTCLLPDGSTNFSRMVAIQGIGGYGKTSIAEEVCLDEEIKSHFTGGIYWLQFGLVNGDDEAQKYAVSFSRSVETMLQDQYGAKQNANLDFKNDATLAQSLFENLPADKLLIVADDLWNLSQISWLANVPDHISILATTRVKSLARNFSTNLEVEHLPIAASRKLILDDLQELNNEQTNRIEEISKAFSGWPLLLKLANSTFKFRQNSGADIEDILDSFERFSKFEGVTSWDAPEAGENPDEMRRKFVGHCIDIGLQALGIGIFKTALLSLGVFPEDTDVPFYVITDYWLELTKENNGTQRINEEKAETIRTRLHDLSFFREYDPKNKALRIHDVFLGYFRQSYKENELKNLHENLVISIVGECKETWHSLEPSHKYGWEYLHYHTYMSGNTDRLFELKSDFQWLKSKLIALGVNGLQRTYSFGENNPAILGISNAINASAFILLRQPRQFAHQIFGRLGHDVRSPEIARIVEQARKDIDFTPKPSEPHLSPVEGEAFVISPQIGEVRKAMFCRDSKTILASHNHPTVIRAYDISTGILKHEIEPAQIYFTDIKSNKERSRVFLVSGNEIDIWDLDRWVRIRKITISDVDISAISISDSGNQLLVLTQDGTIRVWGTLNEESPKFLEGDSFISVAVSADGKLAVTETRDANNSSSVFNVWRLEDCVSIEQLIGTSSRSTEMMFSPDGERILIGTNDCHVLVWNGDVGNRLLTTAKVGESLEKQVSFSPDGKRILCGGGARPTLWNSRDLSQIRELKEARTPTKSAKFSPDGRTIITASYDGCVYLWNGENGSLLEEIYRHRDKANDVDYSQCGHKIVSASEDGTCYVGELGEINKQNKFTTDKGSVNRVGFSLSGDRVFSIFSKSPAFVHKLEAVSESVYLKHKEDTNSLFEKIKSSFVYRKKIKEIRGAQVTGATFLPGDEEMVTVDFSGHANIWSLSDGKIRKTRRILNGSIRRVMTSPNGKNLFFIGNNDATVSVHKSNSLQLVYVLSEAGEWVNDFGFSRCGEIVVTACCDGKARIWNAQNGQLIEAIKASNDWITYAIISSDLKNLLTTSYDGQMRLWDLKSKGLIGEFQITSLHPRPAFLKGCEYVVCGYSPQAIGIWEVDTGKLYRLFYLTDDEHNQIYQKDEIIDFRISDDTESLIILSKRGSLSIWNVAKNTLTGQIIFETNPSNFDQFGPHFDIFGQKICIGFENGMVSILEI